MLLGIQVEIEKIKKFLEKDENPTLIFMGRTSYEIR